MPAISREEVAHLAKLSRLALETGELDLYSAQLERILEHVAQVSEVVAGEEAQIKAMSHPTPIVNVMRADIQKTGLSAQQALDQAPSSDEQRFQVPQILGEE